MNHSAKDIGKHGYELMDNIKQSLFVMGKRDWRQILKLHWILFDLYKWAFFSNNIEGQKYLC